MTDTVGSRLQAAMFFTAYAEMAWREHKQLTAACNEGAAKGHAFRAAELAYDMGQAHATSIRRLTFVLPGVITQPTINGQIGMTEAQIQPLSPDPVWL